MNYIRSLHLDGTGVNFKFGAVVRPVENLRIGVAVHTPTLVSINEEYIEWMSADYKNTARGELLDSPRSLNEYDINTPTRLLTGISYTLPGVGLITADYERVWYNRMKLRNMGTENWDFQQTINNEVSSFYQPANNFRVGIEATPAQNFYIRLDTPTTGSVSRPETRSTTCRASTRTKTTRPVWASGSKTCMSIWPISIPNINTRRTRCSITAIRTTWSIRATWKRSRAVTRSRCR